MAWFLDFIVMFLWWGFDTKGGHIEARTYVRIESSGPQLSFHWNESLSIVLNMKNRAQELWSMFRCNWALGSHWVSQTALDSSFQSENLFYTFVQNLIQSISSSCLKFPNGSPSSWPRSSLWHPTVPVYLHSGASHRPSFFISHCLSSFVCWILQSVLAFEHSVSPFWNILYINIYLSNSWFI